MEWIPAPEARPAGDYVSASRKRITAVVSAPILTLKRRSQNHTARKLGHCHHDWL
jgi:hypothetical protein